jgi:dTDP-4-dehydrorhamnose reductase
VGLERTPSQVTLPRQTLVLGASGFVGREVMDYLGCAGASHTLRNGLIPVDATKISDLRDRLRSFTPELLINCVGLADVDRAESDPPLAEALNVTVVSNLVKLQSELSFRLVHVSTDYVFDGEQGLYREDDNANPVNEYGRSKLRGERAARDSPSALVLRISSPFGKGFGARKPQFFRHLTDSLRAGKSVRALTDQRVTATYLPDLARAIEVLVESGAKGTVHVASEEPLSRFEFALRVAHEIRVDPQLVLGSKLDDMTQWKARRPRDTTLRVDRSREFGVRYTPVSDALHHLLAT